MNESNWKSAFNVEIEDQGIPDLWTLTMDEAFQNQQGWLVYNQKTFARFCCSHCTRWWDSAQVRIIFLIKKDRGFKQGKIRMKIFRQKCKRCLWAVLEDPNITDTNIYRVIFNLVNKIQQKFYSRNLGIEDLNPEVYNDYLDGPHDKARCEACILNVCQFQNFENQSSNSLRQPVVPQRARDYSSFLDYSSTVQHTPYRQQQEEQTNIRAIIIFIVIFFIFILPILVKEKR
uniref:3CxxC-type domain-containing protein n=1 Tax=Leptobrachium leishanense TaxID=445787 RepID=A0A8C5MVK3_9ANUR